MRSNLKILLFLIISAGAISCDQVTKSLAKEHLAQGPGYRFLNDLVTLDYVENPGAAMSLGASWSDDTRFWIFRIMPLAVLMALMVYALRNARQIHPLNMGGLALIFAGGIGNLIDRFFNDSRVPDFMVLGKNGFQTGVFNVADVCITFGTILLLFLQIPPKTRLNLG